MKTIYLYKTTAYAYFSTNKAVSHQTCMTVVKNKIKDHKHTDCIKDNKWFKTFISYSCFVSLSKVFLHPYRNLRQIQLFFLPYIRLITMHIRLPVKDEPP